MSNLDTDGGIGLPISEKDRAFMEELARYYRSTSNGSGQEGSILATAEHFNVSRNKVRKILITTGDIVSPLTADAVKLRLMGKSTKEIASDLGVSVATVSTALPYTDKVYNTFEPSQHTENVRRYRAYERDQARRQVSRKAKSIEDGTNLKGIAQMEEKEWQKDIKMSYVETYHRPHRTTWDDLDALRAERRVTDNEEPDDMLNKLHAALLRHREEHLQEEQEIKELESKKELSVDEQKRLSDLKHRNGLYPGALNSRNSKVLEEIAGSRLPPEPDGVMRLHLELCDDDASVEEKNTIKTLSGLEYGDRITRDILVPADLPLYALHYVIQRAFGWQNSHLYEYTLPQELNVPITCDNASMWSCLVGILFQSPLMDDGEEFWADDYTQGSFKNWLRKKYTGPYMSQCHGEGLYSCQADMTDLDMKRSFYVVFVKEFDHVTGAYSEEEYVADVLQVYDLNGKKLPEPKNVFPADAPSRVEKMPFEAIPVEGLTRLFDRNPFALLKRLPLFAVILPGRDRLSDDPAEQEYISDNIAHNGEEVFLPVEKYVHNLIKNEIDDPLAQVIPPAVTGTLFYRYDLGDNWTIRITASENCPDLVKSGRITQAELDRANVKCRETYRPVLLARDGMMLMDDVGGLFGLADFLETIHPKLDELEDASEIAAAKQEKKEYLEWAKGMGWKRRDRSSNFNLL